VCEQLVEWPALGAELRLTGPPSSVCWRTAGLQAAWHDLQHYTLWPWWRRLARMPELPGVKCRPVWSGYAPSSHAQAESPACLTQALALLRRTRAASGLSCTAGLLSLNLECGILSVPYGSKDLLAGLESWIFFSSMRSPLLD